jgi:hypothetical protein
MRVGGTYHVYHQFVSVALQFSNICITRVSVLLLNPESK